MTISKEDAIFLGGTDWWVGRDPRDVALFQFEARLLCMPFTEFHRCVEVALERPVFTHEFGLSWNDLEHELRGEREPPTFDAILNMLPRERTIVIETSKNREDQ